MKEARATPIRYWNRALAREEDERIYGDAAVRWLYGTGAGRALADHILSGRLASQLYGAIQSSPLSRRKILPFVAEFGIDLNEFEGQPYRSFNDFFVRPFRPGARTFAAQPGRLPAFAEARYLAFSKIDEAQTFPVKGQYLSAEALLGSAERAREFIGGPMLLARLCPTDYHRFHFPDDGVVLEHFRLPGALHSVNPIALKYRGNILATNERHVTLLQTANFGRLAYVEVGALCVGKIVQTYSSPSFRRGDEKGYFLFGASTVIVLGQPGAWHPDADLLEKTQAGKMETYIRLGDAIASRSES